MSFTFPDPSITTTTTHPVTGTTFEYLDGMWTPVSTDAEEVDLSQLEQRVTGIEDVNIIQSEEIDDNQELLAPISNTLNTLESRVSVIEGLDIDSANSTLAIIQQDIIELKAQLQAVSIDNFLILE